MVRWITDTLDNAVLGFVASALAVIAAVLGIGQVTGTGAISASGLQYCIPVALGFGVLAVLTMTFTSLEFSYSLTSVAVFGVLGFASSDSIGFGGLHADTAWYALAAFLLAFSAIGWLAEWSEYDRIPKRAARMAIMTSLAVAGFVPLTYGTGDLPMLLVMAYLAVIGWWAYGEYRIGIPRLPWRAYFATLVLVVVALLIVYPVGSSVAAAVVGLCLVLVATYLVVLLEDAARAAANASTA